MKRLVSLLLALSPCVVFTQNTIGGQAVTVPEAEVNRQSDFLDAERERILGHYDRAIELYKQFLYGNEQNDASWYSLARCFAIHDDTPNALDAIGKAVALAPDNPWYQIFQGDLYEKNGRVKDALRVYEALIKRFPYTPAFQEKLAYLYVLAGDPQNGLKTLDRLEKITGVNEASADKKHLIYLRLGEKKKAAAELQKLVEAYPGRIEYRHHLAEFYDSIGEKDAARRVYAEILRRNPDDPVAKIAALDKNKDASDVAQLQTLQPLFRDPNVSVDAKVKEILPYFDKLEANEDPALTTTLLEIGAVIEKAHPEEAKAWSLSGDLLYYANRPLEALEKYRRCIRLNPTVFSVWENALDILEDQKQTAEMLRLAEQAIDAFPNQPKAYYYYGMAATELGKPDDAINQLQQALLMTGSNLSLWLDIQDQYGWALLRKKDITSALARYEQALAKGGDKHPGILEHYGDALFQSGEPVKALQFWQKAFAIRKTPALEQKISSGKR